MSVKPATGSTSSAIRSNPGAEFESAASAAQATPAKAARTNVGSQDQASRTKTAGGGQTGAEYFNEARDRANDINRHLNENTDGVTQSIVDGTIANWDDKYSRDELKNIYLELINLSANEDGSPNAGVILLRNALSDRLTQ